MNRVKKKIAIVTGGAKGIGQGIAKKLANEGAIVIITDVNKDLGYNFAKSSSSINFIPHNVANENDWVSVINEVDKNFGKIDILVNNAGILATEGIQKIEDTSLQQWQSKRNYTSDA